MLSTVVASLLPLFFMIGAGAMAYRFKKMPENSATVLNAFVYYFTLPALLFYSLASTPFEDILQQRFIGGYVAALFGTYVLTFVVSSVFFKAHYTDSVMRATTGSVSNSAYLGLPIMMYLFHDSQQAFVVTTLAIILPTLIMVISVASLELHRVAGENKTRSRPALVGRIVFSLVKTPLITAAFVGAIFSFAGLELPVFLAKGLRSFGMASIPCALFAIGILIVKLKMEFKFSQIATVNMFKLIIHPILAALFLWWFGVRGQMLLMGIILAGIPTATMVCVLAESYNTCEAETAATLLSSTLLYIPAMYVTLYITDQFGLCLA